MTLVELLATYPTLFYRQAWYADEPFMRALPNDTYAKLPNRTRRGRIPTTELALPLAVELANLYVHTPDAETWSGYLWCRDTDRKGQRVYIGGTANGHGLEIHRHLAVTDLWSSPAWT